MLIEIRSLSHTYAAGTPLERQALRDVCLEIEPGERVGVVGRTGSGKSTLVQHVAGLLRPTSGRVLLDGVAAHARGGGARALRRRIGIAFQYPEEQIFEQSVFDEIAFGPRNLGLRPSAPPSRRAQNEELTRRVTWALTMVGLAPQSFVDRSPFRLSGGETRRVALASILAMQPDVLILDEPTAGLDPRGREELLDRVATWHAEMRLTLIAVSHDLEALARLVDRVIILRAGTVWDDGPTSSVLSDKERLDAAGLRPPPPVALLHRLRDAGWSLQADKILPEEAAAEIAASVGVRPEGRGVPTSPGASGVSR